MRTFELSTKIRAWTLASVEHLPYRLFFTPIPAIVCRYETAVRLLAAFIMPTVAQQLAKKTHHVNIKCIYCCTVS